jgi:8-oxo-dGTP pyrophosphatase MutT (NUDIX family)
VARAIALLRGRVVLLASNPVTPKQLLVGPWRPWRAGRRTVVAAVCYRSRKSGKVEFLLVRTTAGRWTFPKGAVDHDRSAAAAAAREAYEEAGVIGRVHGVPFTRFRYHSRSRGHHVVHAHLCHVAHVDRASEVHRSPTWFSSNKAKQRLREDRSSAAAEELQRVIDAAVRRLC